MLKVDPQLRMMKQSCLFFAAVLLCGTGLARGQASTGSGSIDTTTPAAFLATYDSLAGAAPSQYQSMFSIGDDDDRKLAVAESKFDAQVGMLQKIVQLLWGADAVPQTVHALGMQAGEDIQTAKIVENGSHATVTYADGAAGPILVKTDGGWRLDTAAFRKSLSMPVKDYVKHLRQLSAIIADVADSIDQRKLRSLDTVIHEIAQRTSTIE
jgi:hypothetical protein